MNNFTSKYLKRLTTAELTSLIQKCKYIKKQRREHKEQVITFHIKKSDIVQRGIIE